MGVCMKDKLNDKVKLNMVMGYLHNQMDVNMKGTE